MKEPTTYPLRLPKSVKAAAEELAKAEGVSLNQFIATAVSEKLSALRTEEFFAGRRARAKLPAFDRILARKGGEPPRTGDELPRTARRRAAR